MKEKFGTTDWKAYIPEPVCEQHPEYNAFYIKAWELAFDHIKSIPGMPQDPYMDEAFCATQVWIWDSCFMSLFCKYAPDVFPGVQTFRNFYETLYGGKHLPTILPPDNEPDWTGAVPGTPYEIKVHIADNPPLFAWAEYENALMTGDTEHIRELLCEKKYLQKHYAWLEALKESVTPEAVFIPTYWRSEPCGYHWEGGRSGMDNTPRGRTGKHAEGERPNNPRMLWLDAICEQALAAKCIAKLYELIGEGTERDAWMEKFEQKKKLVNELYWDKEDAFYYDIDCETHVPMKVKSIASYWTMTAGIASQKQAEALVAELNNEETFGGFVPFVSLARNDNDYRPGGQYWRGSVWLPTAYAALKGLSEYGFYAVAHTTGEKLLSHMYHTYTDFEPHTIWECYSPEAYKPGTIERVDSEKLVRKDFCGWSALGPIAVYIEYVLGFHTINALERVVKWEKPTALSGRVGIRKLRFGSVVTDIVAEGNICRVQSNEPYTLEICGKAYAIGVGETVIDL